MSGGKRRWWLAILAILGVAAFCLFVLLRSGGQFPSQRLADGSVVSIRKVSYGKIHRYVPGSWWQRFAGQILPDPLLMKMGVHPISSTNATDSLMIFVEVVRTDMTPQQAATPVDWGWSTAFVSDDAANEFVAPSHPMFVMSKSGRESSLHRLTIPLLSFAATILHFELALQNGSSNAVTTAHFTIPNPARGSRQSPAALPLPQTNHLDNLDVVLLELNSYRPQAMSGILEPDRDTVFTRARFHILENGLESKNWKMIGATVFDELGNSYSPNATYFPDSMNPDRLAFNGGFSPNETRRFRFRLSREPFPYKPAATDKYVEFLARPSPVSPQTAEGK